MKQISFWIIPLAAALGAALGCTGKSQTSQVSLIMPKLTSTEPLQLKANAQNVSATSDDGFNKLLNPSSLSEFNCYLVFVGGSGYDSGGSCTVSDGTSFTLGGFVGGMVSGASTEILVPSGSDRNLVLIGFKTDDVANCRDFHVGLPKAKLSEPYVLARQSLNLSPGTTTVDMNPQTMTAKITNCNFANDSSGSDTAYYGSGSDGDLNTSSIFNLTSMQNASGQYYLSQSAVDSITDLGNGTGQITVNASWNTSSFSHVKSGDEVMLYVLGGSEPGGCNQVFSGFSLSGLVASASTGGSAGKTFVMQINDSRWFGISAANLTASATGSTLQTFCRVMAVRVPHFNSINVTFGDLTMRVSSGGNASFTSNSHTAVGLIPIRVKNKIQVDSGRTFDLTVTGSGYAGGANGSNVLGESFLGRVTGYLSSTAGYGSGGGYDSGIACGGGHGGQGGCSSSTTFGGQPVGDEYGCGALDNSKSCLRGKFFLGGGGGADSGGGGAGGGAVRLIAREIVNNGTLNILARGGSGVSIDDGGGAGGSIYAVAEKLSGTGAVLFDARGGTASSSWGGVGGGGRIHVVVKDSASFSGTKSADVGVGATGNTAGATSGTCLTSGAAMSGCSGN